MNFEQQNHFTALLGDVQSDHEAKKKAMVLAVAEENCQLAKTKRDREKAEHVDFQNYGKTEVEFTTANDFMTENPAAEQSMLGAHRVKPYGFKGFNDGQKNAVLHERQQQCAEQSMMKQNEKESEALWAMQGEHMRRA